jgi:hypothetical protein
MKASKNNPFKNLNSIDKIGWMFVAVIAALAILAMLFENDKDK